jgi:hypothetical protein
VEDFRFDDKPIAEPISDLLDRSPLSADHKVSTGRRRQDSDARRAAHEIGANIAAALFPPN